MGKGWWRTELNELPGWSSWATERSVSLSAQGIWLYLKQKCTSQVYKNPNKVSYTQWSLENKSKFRLYTQKCVTSFCTVFKILHTQTGFFSCNRKTCLLPSAFGRSSPKGKKLDLSLHHGDRPTIPFWDAPAESSPATSWTVERMLSENLDKDKLRLMSPGKMHSLDLDLTPAQDALQKLTLWKTLETNYLWGFLGFIYLFFFDTLYQSITTFYKRYSVTKGFWDYVNQDKSTGDTSLNINTMRLSSLFFPPLTEEEVAQFKLSGH